MVLKFSVSGGGDGGNGGDSGGGLCNSDDEYLHISHQLLAMMSSLVFYRVALVPPVTMW